ncbi:DUF1048 domain-containing protein [Clostridium gasigenes]|uniref:DUF1048 domain-containing protein n=1 Tax=Clostridium gasigenes TaxID=94869 RepID=UPI001C0D6896|nr:DUF1048 domain-containing protein [Clostridium gasigenes]MBU3107051.1 DUF1048 domain-containing protein [Clostridium gasigenes]
MGETTNNEKESYEDYKKYIHKLEDEYLDTFRKVESYISSSTKLNQIEKNNCFLQVLDTFLSVQTEERNIKYITGLDLKKYCDNMIYGEGLSLFKGARIFYEIIAVVFYVSWMHLFIRILYVVFSYKGSSIIYEPMIFGIGEIILALSYICIPILGSQITKKHFQNPKRCKRLKLVVDNVVWLIGIIIYTFMEQNFGQYGVTISFNTLVLTLIYLALARISVWILVESFNKSKLEQEAEQLKYEEAIKNRYLKHKVKCEKKNKEPLIWHAFLKKKTWNNKIFKIIFSIYVVIILALIILMGRGMIINNNIDIIGIILLIVMSFIEVLLIGVVMKSPTKMEE